MLLFCGCSSGNNFIISTPTPTINELVTLFSSEDHNDRVHAAYQAGLYRDTPEKEMLLPYLVDALSGPDLSDRGGRKEFAAQSIRYLGIYDETAYQIFISWINDGKATNGEILQAILALQEFPNTPEVAKPGLIRALNNDDNHVKQAAIELLSAFDDKDVIPSILSIALSDKEESWVRQDALRAIAIFGTDSKYTITKLIPLLDHQEAETRAWAAAAIYFASDKSFPSEDLDWDLSHWRYSSGFTKVDDERSDRYIIVVEAKKWWRESGRFNEWPDCD